MEDGGSVVMFPDSSDSEILLCDFCSWRGTSNKLLDGNKCPMCRYDIEGDCYDDFGFDYSLD